MAFERQTLMVNHVKIVMLTAGQGEPLLFLHGAGTWHGFDFALPWASKFRVMIPYHPGWGESEDALDMTTVHDYVMHYLELIDQLGLNEVHLVGQSMGGRLAATFASEHRRRVRKLVCVCPAGLEVPGHPTADLSKVPPGEIPSYLAEDMSVVTPHLANASTPEWQAARARESASFFKLVGTGMFDPKFSRWLHRCTMPTLLVWGDRDRITPVQQAEAWTKHIPGAKVHRYWGAGHLVLDEKPESVRAVAEFLAADAD
jgi:pimeloyl-ACP methyl ester carboxylesterase